MYRSRENTNYWNNNEYSQEECLEMTRLHRKSVMDTISVFCHEVKNLWKEHDKDKETPENLEKYTYLLNHPEDDDANNEWKNIHNFKNTHHVEWFLACAEPKLQHLVEMTCDHVASAIARDAKFENIFEQNKKRYIQKWLPEDIAIICTNTFIDLWESIHENKIV